MKYFQSLPKWATLSNLRLGMIVAWKLARDKYFSLIEPKQVTKDANKLECLLQEKNPEHAWIGYLLDSHDTTMNNCQGQTLHVFCPSASDKGHE
jgi:hypothetical protein